jgi:hypothetical protein
MEQDTRILIEKINALILLRDLRTYCLEQRDSLKIKDISEYDYCTIQGKLEAINDFINKINQKIKEYE